jgi:hypothetical protein
MCVRFRITHSMSHLASLSLSPSADMDLGVSGTPSKWWTWRAPCEKCRTLISYRKGIFCVNFFTGRGNWKPFQKARCGDCYTPLKGNHFPVRLPKDEEGNLLVNEEDKLRFAVARPGDHLFCPFQCELCHFRNLQGRSPQVGSGLLGDVELLKCLRRVNLDAFWSREPSTVGVTEFGKHKPSTTNCA